MAANSNEYSFDSSAVTFYSFMGDLNTHNGFVVALPYSLSPIAFMVTLLRARRVVDAAYLNWNVLAMPEALYRSDTAYELLRKQFSRADPQLPFYFFGLDEVRDGKWGWSLWRDDIQQLSEI